MKNIIQDYKNLKLNIGILIQKSGYKNAFIAQKIGMNPSNFSIKKKRDNWTDDELEKLLDIIKDEEMEDYFLGKLMESRKDDETISLAELKLELGDSKIN